MIRRVLYLILTFILSYTSAQAFELVLPYETQGDVTTDYILFVGKAKKTELISINDERIFIAPNGAFAHSVKLNNGENTIKVKSNYQSQVFTYYKKQKIKQEYSIEEFSPQKALVKADNTPLRSTPVDAGLNRIGHLFADTSIIINGVQGDFFRVFLSKNTTAWIAKKDVVVKPCDKFIPAEFLSMNSEHYKNASVQTISFSKRIPYTIEDKEQEIIFRIYNPELSGESVYNINIPKSKKYAYSINMTDNTYEFKVKKIPTEVKDLTVVIDAGHGGTERGAIGCLGDKEKDVNLKIAKELEKQLSSAGIRTLMTRESDNNLSLNERIRISKECGADIFVSIHLNSIGDIPMNIHKTRGTSIFYFNDNSESFAKEVLKTATHYAGTRNDGIHTASFAVIRPTDYIAILVESAYMTNPLDSVLYRQESFSKNIAKGIAEGILTYIKK